MKKWLIDNMEISGKYQISFPSGESARVELKERKYLGCDELYVFSPIYEEDRVFSEHENWQVLGWDEPWWFALPEGILYQTEIKFLDENNIPLSKQEMNYVYLLVKIEEVNKITPEQIERNLTRTAKPLDELLVFAKNTELTDSTKQMVVETVEKYVEKLKEAKEKE